MTRTERTTLTVVAGVMVALGALVAGLHGMVIGLGIGLALAGMSWWLRTRDATPYHRHDRPMD